jgi:hypothetical protein
MTRIPTDEEVCAKIHKARLLWEELEKARNLLATVEAQEQEVEYRTEKLALELAKLSEGDPQIPAIQMALTKARLTNTQVLLQIMQLRPQLAELERQHEAVVDAASAMQDAQIEAEEAGIEHNQHPSASSTHAAMPEENDGPSFLGALGADTVVLGVRAAIKFAGGYILGWLIIGLLGVAVCVYEFCAYFGVWLSLATAAGICGWFWGMIRIMKSGEGKATRVQVAFWLNIAALLFLRKALGGDNWPWIFALLAIGTVLYSLPFRMPSR